MGTFTALGLSVAALASAPLEPRSFCFAGDSALLDTPDILRLMAVGRALTGDNYRSQAMVVSAPGAWGDDDLIDERLAQIQLELLRQGVGLHRQRVERGETGSSCIEVRAYTGPGPGLVLWHHHGPYFESGSADIPPAAVLNMRFLAADYRPGHTMFRIEGHADTRGDPDVNMDLSQRRADAVARELIRLGVRHEDIETTAYGDTQLARPTSDDVAEPLNRRAHIDVRARSVDGGSGR